MVNVERYGGRRAYLMHMRERALYAFGAYRSARSVQWTMVTRLVFVCQGNICRSPYASARARALSLSAISFGLDAAEGVGADRSAVRHAASRGIDLSAHLSARLQPPLVAQGDLIVVFEPEQLRSVMRHRIAGLAGVTLLGIWSQRIRPHIQDPYGRSDSYFQQCFSAIDQGVHGLMCNLLTHEALIISSTPTGRAPALTRLISRAGFPRS